MCPEPAITVLAVDDQAAMRHALRGLIASARGFEQIGEAASGGEALQRVRELRPDLVLLDVRLPDIDGLETLRRLTADGCDALVVLISLDAALTLPDGCGAAAYIPKQHLSVARLREVWDARGGSRHRG